MKITYIYHSGFLVETTECYYLFDYYKGILPDLNQQKTIIVFASHNHSDHYNPKIFSILKDMGMENIIGVLAKDISPDRYPKDIEIIKATFYQEYELEGTTHLETFHSTDAGVAFLIQCPQGIIYHAGDLNDWTWEGESERFNKQMTGSYRHEIDLLSKSLNGKLLDAAFLPLDPRQGKEYAKGILYFLKKINVYRICPMHYWEQPEIIDKFIKEYPEYQGKITRTENIGVSG